MVAGRFSGEPDRESARNPFIPIDSGMPRGWWRGPIHTFGAFAVESFIDEIAHATKQDPLALRLKLLGAAARTAVQGLRQARYSIPDAWPACCKLAADKIGWGRKLDRRSRPRHRLPFHLRRLCRACVRGVGNRRQRGDPSRGVRDRCRPRGQSARRRGADRWAATIDGISTRAQSGDHGQGRPGTTIQFSRLSTFAHGPGAAEVEVVIAPSERTPSAPTKSACPARRRR